MGPKKLAIVGLVIVAAALLYFAFGKSANVTDLDRSLTPIADTSATGGELNTTGVANTENAEDEAPSNGVADGLLESSSGDNLELEFSRLVSEDGMHSNIAHRFLTSRDFNRLFDLARDSDRNSESYEIEATYQDIFMDSEQVRQNDVFIMDFACDNRVCLMIAEYDNHDDTNLFMQHVFYQEGRGAVGIIPRTVSIDGVKQLRIIFDYQGNSLILE